MANIVFTASGLEKILNDIKRVEKSGQQTTTLKFNAETQKAELDIKKITSQKTSNKTIKVNADTTPAQSTINKFSSQKTPNKTIRVDADTSSAKQGLSGLGGIGKTAMAGLNVAAIGAGIGMFKVAASTEQLRIAWGTVAKADAPGIMERIKEVAKTTPYSITEVSNSIMKLYNTGLRGEELYGVFQKLGDTAGAVGAPVETVIAAYSKMAAAGRVGAEEMNMLTDAGVNAWGILANAMGQPVSAVRKLSEEGKLGADSVNLLRDAMGKEYSGGMEAQSQSFNGKLSTLIDTIQESLLPTFTKLIDGIKPFLDFITNNPGLVIFGAALLALVPIISIISGLFTIMTPVAIALGVGVWSVVWPILAIIAAIALVIVLFQNWDAIMQFLGNAIKMFFAFIGALIKNILDKVGEFFKWIGEKIGDFFKWVGEIPGKIVDFFKGIGEKIAEFFKVGIDKIKDFFIGIVDFFKSIPQKIADLFSGLGDLLKNALRFAIDLLPGFISGPLKNLLGLFEIDFADGVEAYSQVAFDTSRLQNQAVASNTTNNNNTAMTFNKGIESRHERVKLSASMQKLRGRIK